MTPRCSIVIPCYQHAAVIGHAIESALAQTVPVEVIVVNDGSVDTTIEAVRRYLPSDPCDFSRHVRFFSLPHGGPSLARNYGLDKATAEFVMLLDADDTIEPTKVADQIEAFTPEIGWVLSDVKIEDARRGLVELASKRYDYPRKELGGWIGPLLEPANFIPIMSPLVRRSVRTRRATSYPSISGRRISKIIRSGRTVCAARTPSSPQLTVNTS